MLSRAMRVAGNPWLRAGLLVTVLALCGYGLYSEWPQVMAGLARLHWYSVSASLTAAVAGSACMMLAWRAILADLGSPLRLAAAARISFVSALGKYLPGAVWAFAAQLELAHELGIPRRRSAASFAVSLALLAGVGLGVAAIALPLAAPGTARSYWWVLAAVPLIAGALCPPVFGRVMDRALVLARRQPLEHRPSWPGIGRALAWTIAGWALLGVQVWLLVSDMSGQHRYLLLAGGGYALAFSAGLLLVVFPGGIGAREVILIAVLSSALPHGTAVAVALMARVITTVADLACAGLGLTLGRGTRGAVAATAVATTAVATTGAGPPGSGALPSGLTSGALRQ
jgi:uncharacterized membrane protein YbhN (UPF0104 family)